MKNIWKWLFFILLALVVIAGIVMALNFNAMANFNGYVGGGMMSSFGGRTFGYHDFNGMRGGHTSLPFFAMPFMLFGFGLRLLPLVVIGLIVWGIYRMGVTAGRQQVQPSIQPTAPVQPAQPNEPTPAPENKQEEEIQ